MQNKSNGVCELIADELEQIAGGGCPDGVLNTLNKNTWGGAIAGDVAGAIVGGPSGSGPGLFPAPRPDLPPAPLEG